MADLGARSYRFSVSWSRVLPNGTGVTNERGLDFYQRLVDALLGSGVKPLINLFHWDLPQVLQDRGGFADPQVVGWFTDYAALLASKLGDRVKDWMTFNEPAVFAFLGHADGIHAPGLRDWPTAIRVADNQLRAHASAAEAIRAVVDQAKIGIAIDVNQVAPATNSERDRVAASQWSSARDAWFLDPLFGRGYPALGLDAHREAGHLEGVDLGEPPAGNLDYLGLNYYRRDSVSARSDRAFDWDVGAQTGSEQTQMGWHVASDGLRDVLLELNQTYRPREIVVSENGAAYPDTVEEGSRVRDQGRQAYLARHVAAAADALRAGVPLTGYYVWSLLDNYEWSLGYTRRFGLVHVDFASQRRTPKDSARWFQRLIAPGADPMRPRRARARRSLLDGAGQEPSHEGTLQQQEDDQRHDHRHERARGQDVPLATAVAVEHQQRRWQHPLLLAGAQEDQRHQEVVPDPQELEDREGADGRDRQRQHESDEHLEMRRAVDGGRLEQVAWQLRHEVVQQEDGQRQAECRVREPDAQERAVEPDAARTAEGPGSATSAAARPTGRRQPRTAARGMGNGSRRRHTQQTPRS